MSEYVLFRDEVRKLIRKENYGDPRFWLTEFIEVDAMGRKLLRWVPAKDCTLLDPALNVLFERKEDEC